MSLGGSGGAEQVEQTAAEREQLKIAADTWDRYKETFVPIENAMVDKIRSYDTEGYRENKVGEAATVAKRNQLQARGGASGHFLGDILQHGVQTGAIAGMGGAETGQETREQYGSGLQGMTQIGHNIRQTASQGMTGLAGISNTEARRQSIADAKEKQNMMQGVGQFAGMGASYLNSPEFDNFNSSVEGMPGFIGPPSALMGATSAVTAPSSNPFMPQFNW